MDYSTIMGLDRAAIAVVLGEEKKRTHSMHDKRTRFYGEYISHFGCRPAQENYAEREREAGREREREREKEGNK